MKRIQRFRGRQEPEGSHVAEPESGPRAGATPVRVRRGRLLQIRAELGERLQALRLMEVELRRATDSDAQQQLAAVTGAVKSLEAAVSALTVVPEERVDRQ